MQTAHQENLAKYERQDVVSFYEQATELQPAEAYLLGKYIQPRSCILDMGVGGGRTTPHLARLSERYVGADYSRAMVEACRKRFPHLQFVCCDARDLSLFRDAEFDAVVFSFNGIDVLDTDEGRAQCLAETARVLKSGGVFIFSSHNAKVLARLPSLQSARAHQVVWRLIRFLWGAPRTAMRSLRSEAFRKGEGYIHDPVHGGLYTYVSTPETFAPQLAAARLLIQEVVGGPDPNVRSRWLTSWNYYVCRKI